MGNEMGMGKAPPMGNPRPQSHVYLSGDGDDFEGGDVDEKAFSGPTSPRCHP
ncbi:hypothetical protein TIFTF001_014933 [Ficus carica]|uniref:Uncharacterized protein n=1 Tax=Ficus carica TaxID=3494 RepID=A0AA88A4R4_FICCA|nr:hypothetical protein TIFTF001_014933 [Ficus carica]